jgi:hypothetical protein
MIWRTNQRQKHNSRNKEKKERQLVQKPEVTPGKQVTCLIVVVVYLNGVIQASVL